MCFIPMMSMPQPTEFNELNQIDLFRPVPNIRGQNLIQFVKHGDQVVQKSRESYSGEWTDHGTLLKRRKSWPLSMHKNTIPRSEATLSASRLLHIRENIFALLDYYVKPCWNLITHLDISEQEKQRRQIF